MDEYKIVHALSIDQLEKQVNKMLGEDWQVQGGVAYDGESNVFIQAVTRRITPSHAYTYHYVAGIKLLETEP